MKLRFIFCGIALSLLATVVPTLAQTPPEQPSTNAAISGRVVNARDGEPLALVQAELTGTSYRAITGEDGTFLI